MHAYQCSSRLPSLQVPVVRCLRTATSAHLISTLASSPRGLQAVASLLGFVGAANLPGVVLPLLGQTILIWQVKLLGFCK